MKRMTKEFEGHEKHQISRLPWGPLPPASRCFGCCIWRRKEVRRRAPLCACRNVNIWRHTTCAMFRDVKKNTGVFRSLHSFRFFHLAGDFTLLSRPCEAATQVTNVSFWHKLHAAKSILRTSWILIWSSYRCLQMSSGLWDSVRFCIQETWNHLGTEKCHRRLSSLDWREKTEKTKVKMRWNDRWWEMMRDDESDESRDSLFSHLTESLAVFKAHSTTGLHRKAAWGHKEAKENGESMVGICREHGEEMSRETPPILVCDLYVICVCPMFIKVTSYFFQSKCQLGFITWFLFSIHRRSSPVSLGVESQFGVQGPQCTVGDTSATRISALSAKHNFKTRSLHVTKWWSILALRSSLNLPASIRRSKEVRGFLILIPFCMKTFKVEKRKNHWQTIYSPILARRKKGLKTT